MSRLPTTCPGCGATLLLSETVSPGQRVKCPKCQSPFAVPSPDRGPRPRRRFKRKKQPLASTLAPIIALSVFLVVAAAVVIYFVKVRGKKEVPDGGINIGQMALEISGEDIDGNPFKLSDYRGKVVVLDFWGNW